MAVGIHGTPSSASQYQLSVVVTDTGRSPCVLSGFPGFELSGEGKTYDPVRQGVPYSSVTVASGQQAHATFTALPGPDSCDAGTAWVPSRVLVTLPGGTRPLSSSWPGGSVDDCQGGATHPGTFIAPFLPGS